MEVGGIRGQPVGCGQRHRSRRPRLGRRLTARNHQAAQGSQAGAGVLDEIAALRCVLAFLEDKWLLHFQ